MRFEALPSSQIHLSLCHPNSKFGHAPEMRVQWRMPSPPLSNTAVGAARRISWLHSTGASVEKVRHTSHHWAVGDDAEFLRQQAAFCRQAAESVKTGEAKRSLLEAAALFEAKAREQQISAGVLPDRHE